MKGFIFLFHVVHFPLDLLINWLIDWFTWQEILCFSGKRSLSTPVTSPQSYTPAWQEILYFLHLTPDKKFCIFYTSGDLIIIIIQPKITLSFFAVFDNWNNTV